MTKIWKWVAIVSLALLILGIALIGVSYVTGGSVQRLITTTDIADMTKFISRETLEKYLTLILG